MPGTSGKRIIWENGASERPDESPGSALVTPYNLPGCSRSVPAALQVDGTPFTNVDEAGVLGFSEHDVSRCVWLSRCDLHPSLVDDGEV